MNENHLLPDRIGYQGGWLRNWEYYFISRSGVASVFTPSLGTVQECNTSAAVTIIRIGEFNGSAIRLSVSSRRNISICWSFIMYKSNCSFVKSEYPYLQYHWWPTALNIKTGLCMSSINLLKPTGYVMHQQFNIQQQYALPTLYLCVLYLSENKQRLVPLTA